MELKEAKQVYKEYFACPECKDAVYHTSALTHRNYECKDCRQTFKVPDSVKIAQSKPFHRKPDYKAGK